MINIVDNSIRICFDDGSLRFTLCRGETVWEWNTSYVPCLEYEGGRLEFKDAASISHVQVENGIGRGIRSRYEGFCIGDVEIPYTFET